ncbi:MAG: hypothetical protein ACN6QT_24845 [Burkholderia contaminans]|uniref:Secreted protein n=1 Tax=Burkholderia contaminans TaxID=488447 RepID=A0AAP4R803_9BURK|nr:hypothetical protein [Burkholderia contaminans]MBD1414093.1 hypothetical protein [Burkholderia contaminans]MBH9670825.1 hypothetical protein [Burkholderia contaminans]MBH9677743.1 hypothetical protein [Burkholderia contaminans]MBH9708167.1 hypothetical protein [Burkholderia contaminans]MBH9722523.1 hypothetical protein [Burkholderia contaminans]
MRFKLILLICVPLSMSMRTLRANGLPRANACPVIYGTEAYNLNTGRRRKPAIDMPPAPHRDRRRDSPRPLC